MSAGVVNARGAGGDRKTGANVTREGLDLAAERCACTKVMLVSEAVIVRTMHLVENERWWLADKDFN